MIGFTGATGTGVTVTVGVTVSGSLVIGIDGAATSGFTAGAIGFTGGAGTAGFSGGLVGVSSFTAGTTGTAGIADTAGTAGATGTVGIAGASSAIIGAAIGCAGACFIGDGAAIGFGSTGIGSFWSGASPITGGNGEVVGAGGINTGFFFLIIAFTGGTVRRGRAALLADVVSGFPQQGQNLMTISQSSQ